MNRFFIDSKVIIEPSFSTLTRGFFSGDIKLSPFDTTGRGFISCDVKIVKIYLEKVHEILLDHDVFNRMQRLLRSPISDNIEVEKLDNILTEACEIGEDACCRRQKYHWSVDLHKIKRQLSIWGIFQSLRRRNLPIISIITRANEKKI